MWMEENCKQEVTFHALNNEGNTPIPNDYGSDPSLDLPISNKTNGVVQTLHDSTHCALLPNKLVESFQANITSLNPSIDE